MRVRTPTVIQMESVECGAAALGMVLGYYGRYVSLEQLRSDCGISRNGSNAKSILKAARAYGLEASGKKTEPRHLPEMTLPVIVFWNFNHFLVVEGFRKDKVFLNDPVSGPRTVTWEEFDRSFTGIVLSFRPTAEFRKGGRPPSLFRSLYSRLGSSGSSLLYATLASLALVVPGLVAPAFIQIFVDDVMGRHYVDWILPLLACMLVTIGVMGLLTWIQQYFLARMETRLAIVGSSRFFWHLMRLPMEFYLQRYSGEIGSRVSLNDDVAEVLSSRLVSAAVNVLMMGFYGWAMLLYDVRLTMVVVALAAINLVTLLAVGRSRVDLNRRLQQYGGKLTGSLLGGLQLIETLKASGRESDLFARWAGYLAQTVRARQEFGLSSEILSTVPSVTTTVGSVIVLVVGSYRVLEGAMSIGMLFAFLTLMGSFLGPVNSLLAYGSDIQRSFGDLGRLDDVLENRIEVDPMAPSRARPGEVHARLSGRVELRGLTFGYSRTDPPLLDDFSITVEPGQRVAFVGATGSGKTTLGRLITGIYRPWSGQILFDGRPAAEIPREVLTASFAHVDQDIVLFDGTVRDNLTLWNPHVDDAVLVRALQDAWLDQEVLERVGGLDGRILEGGRDLSGGQRQRLEIARALAVNPSILLLDEATSALDPLVEQEIDRRLRARGVTCLIIAHRLSTIRDADEIVVLDHGRVAQRGRHEVLMAVPGHYQDLIRAELGEPVA